MKTCLECYNLFDRYTDLIPYSPCPIFHCGGKVVDIDDNILQTIIQLNQKGYPTAFCCAGHTWGNDPYIVFDDSVNINAFPNLPKAFKSEITPNGALRIYKSIPSNSAIDTQKLLMEAVIDLMEWSDRLKPSLLLMVDFELNDKVNLLEIKNEIQQRFNVTTDLSKEDDGIKRLISSTLISHKNSKTLERKIKSFANEKGVAVSIDIID